MSSTTPVGPPQNQYPSFLGEEQKTLIYELPLTTNPIPLISTLVNRFHSFLEGIGNNPSSEERQGTSIYTTSTTTNQTTPASMVGKKRSHSISKETENKPSSEEEPAKRRRLRKGPFSNSSLFAKCQRVAGDFLNANLPNEVIVSHLLPLLSERDLICLSKTCKFMRFFSVDLFYEKLKQLPIVEDRDLTFYRKVIMHITGSQPRLGTLFKRGNISSLRLCLDVANKNSKSLRTQLNNITTLCLYGTKMPRNYTYFAVFADNLTKLETLHLHKCFNLYCYQLEKINSTCPSLKSLIIEQCSPIDDEGLKILANHPHLKEVALDDITKITEVGLKTLKDKGITFIYHESIPVISFNRFSGSFEPIFDPNFEGHISKLI